MFVDPAGRNDNNQSMNMCFKIVMSHHLGAHLKHEDTSDGVHAKIVH